MSSRGNLTPRRPNFKISTDHDGYDGRGGDYLPVPRSPSLRPPTPTREAPPGSPNRMHFKDAPYHNPSRISPRSICYMLLFALSIFGFLAFLSRTPTESDKLIGTTDLEELEKGEWGISEEEYLGECMEMDHHHGGFWDKPQHQEHEHEEAQETKFDPETGLPVCSTSVTYLLTPGVGLAFHLQLMAQAWGLAKATGRPFFIEDDGWDRGKWTDHFRAWKNKEECSRPPREDLRACPRTAQHWVVMPITRAFHFGHDYEKLEYAKGRGVDRKRPFFDMAQEALNELFIPSEQNQQLIDLAVEELTDGQDVPHISVHLRKGDKHPQSWWHRNDYIPVEDFVDSIKETWGRLVHEHEGQNLPAEPNIYIASDSPLDITELHSRMPKTWKSYSLYQSDYAKLRRIASPSPYDQEEFNDLTQYQRRELTRGAIVDLALLGGGWGRRNEGFRPLAVICTQSSNICRFVPFMFGWDDSFEHKLWIDLDFKGSVDWTWFPI